MTNIDKCSHGRATKLFRESLSSNFTAMKCSSYKQIKNGRCSFFGVTGIMGGDVTSNAHKPIGIFYLETKEDNPYVISDISAFTKIKITTEIETDEDDWKIHKSHFAIGFGVIALGALVFLVVKLKRVNQSATYSCNE